MAMSADDPAAAADLLLSALCQQMEKLVIADLDEAVLPIPPSTVQSAFPPDEARQQAYPSTIGEVSVSSTKPCTRRP